MHQLAQLKTKKGNHLDLFNGDSRNSDMTFILKDENADAIDITSWTIKAILKEALDDPDAAAMTGGAAIDGTVTDGPNGTFTLPWSTTTITGDEQGAALIIYRVASGKNLIQKQYKVDVWKSGLD